MATPHFVLLPFMAQGHTIPMVDIARLLATRNCLVTILLTPVNANRVKPVLDRAILSGLSIRVELLKFPAVEAGLREGCENFDMLESLDDALKFFVGITMLKDQVQDLLHQLDPPPSCLLADFCFTWASKAAQSLQIPRILFHGFCCFSLFCFLELPVSKEFEAAASDMDYVVLPKLPDRIEMTRAQIRGTYSAVSNPAWVEFWGKMRDDEQESFGTIVNTFQQLEPEYIKLRRRLKEKKKLWCIGPVSLCNKDESDMAERGNKASIDKAQIFTWLDSQEPGSVVYVCLGSLAKLPPPQMVELGLGLESSNRPFIWVVRDPPPEFNAWLSEENYEERTKGRGVVIRGWAPQVLILSHPSVGCFLTHCGWNSSLEGIAAGLPMITWPVLGEQFCNEKLIVSVIKTGVSSGVKVPVGIGDRVEDGKVQVKSEEIKRAIEDAMDGGEEGRERRERARKLGEAAKMAVEEGGSSYDDIALLIQKVVNFQFPNGGEGEESAADDSNCEIESSSSSTITVN